MKTYRHCYCESKHRTYETKAKCLWKRQYWIDGDGPYALLAHCRVLTITLHKTQESAEADKELIDRTACGGMCNKRHEIIKIDF